MNYRLNFHITPEKGWLNDPNGLVQIGNEYHFYYQYSKDVNGGLKEWGHVSTEDFINYQYFSEAITPSIKEDINGVYSGSCFKKDEICYFFYTGNVKEIGDFDYINNGREQNTILITSKDGINFNDKKVLLHNNDYPNFLTCHVRDPKIFEYKNKYYMFLGARMKKDKGSVIVYESNDLSKWSYIKNITTKEKFGYMWECPDFINLNNDFFLLVCPQGLTKKGDKYQNIYSSGYFKVNKNGVYDYQEFDYGFDFYAPQTFKNSQGDTILIGWMGMPDADYTNPTIEEGWQHAFTIPRKLTNRNGKIYQSPICELKKLRIKKLHISDYAECYELNIMDIKGMFKLKLIDDIELVFDGENLILDLGESGSGRTRRYINDISVNSLQIFKDISSLEVFINNGEYVMTSRIYPREKTKISLDIEETTKLKYYELSKFNIKKAINK